jgi:hypothetical protein
MKAELASLVAHGARNRLSAPFGPHINRLREALEAKLPVPKAEADEEFVAAVAG